MKSPALKAIEEGIEMGRQRRAIARLSLQTLLMTLMEARRALVVCAPFAAHNQPAYADAQQAIDAINRLTGER